MGNTENTSNSRQKCVWRVKQFDSKGKAIGGQPCGSEERIFEVKGRGKYIGRPRSSPICQKHLPDAIREWDYDTAVPIDGRLVVPHPARGRADLSRRGEV